MPELAEVEFYRKRWAPGTGGRVCAVLAHRGARIFRECPAAAVERALAGRVFEAGHAHGKRLLFGFSGGAWLGLHLGMSGRLRADPASEPSGRHDHLVLDLGGLRLVFTDPRMFGRVTLDCTGDGAPPAWWRELPPGVLDRRYTLAHLVAFVSRFPRTPLKTLLLDQRGFPGLGNWMADEVCWRLRLPPRTAAGELDGTGVAALRRAVRRVSRDALRTIGEDWSDPPASWLFRHRWQDGGRCPRPGCGGEPLLRAELRGRTTCWCPRCQPG